MKFNKRYDYMFRQMVANLPVTNSYNVRIMFKEWWERLGRVVDSEEEE